MAIKYFGKNNQALPGKDKHAQPLIQNHIIAQLAEFQFQKTLIHLQANYFP